MATVQEEFLHWFPGLGFRPAVFKERKDFAGDIGTHTYVFVAPDANTPYQKFDKWEWEPEPESFLYTSTPAPIYNQFIRPEYKSVFVNPPPIFTCCSTYEPPPPPPPPPIPIMESGFLMITCLMALAMTKFRYGGIIVNSNEVH